MTDGRLLASSSGGTAGVVSKRFSRKLRKVHHKVKTGCGACKRRHQKCDELKPVCSGCNRYSTPCIYEERVNLTPEEPISRRATSSTRSPLQVSPSRSLEFSPCAALDLSDLELMHQWLTNTCIASGQLPEITVYVLMTVPPLAQEFPFVMHGILAMAATQLSRLRPAREAYYLMLAAKHHGNGLPDFRSALQSFGEADHGAVISYSKSILWCAMASKCISSGGRNAADVSNGWLPEWFQLLRGSCQVVDASRGWIREGPHALSHALPRLDIAAVSQNISDDRQMTVLASVLHDKTASPLLTKVLSTLREAFARASMQHHNTPIRNAINFWIGALPKEYVRLVQCREPWALVILAQFCVLVHRLEAFEFTPGHARQLVQAIASMLDMQWAPCIRWAEEQVGVA